MESLPVEVFCPSLTLAKNSFEMIVDRCTLFIMRGDPSGTRFEAVDEVFPPPRINPQVKKLGIGIPFLQVFYSGTLLLSRPN